LTQTTKVAHYVLVVLGETNWTFTNYKVRVNTEHLMLEIVDPKTGDVVASAPQSATLVKWKDLGPGTLYEA
jgi:hypothetical protein